MIISDVIQDGSLYNYRGVEIDIENKTIKYRPCNVCKSITIEDFDRINECIKYNLDIIITEVNYINSRLNQIHTKIITIENGYKIREPLNEKMRLKYEKNLEKLNNDKYLLESIKLQDLL